MVEAAPRLDRRADDDEFGAALGGDPGDVLADTAGARADDLAADTDTVRGSDGSGGVETCAQRAEIGVEARLKRQLALDDERRHEDHPRATIGCEPAGEVERMLRLLPLEQRHDDAPIGDRARPARQTARATEERPDVGQPHRTSG